MKNVRVDGKLGTMRQVVDWVVYPPGEDTPNILYVQSDKRIVKIDTATKKGMLSKSCTHPGFHMTLKLMGATEIDVPQSFIDDCIAAQPHKGDEVAPGLIIG